MSNNNAHSRVHIDLQTFSDVDINKVAGVPYARHPSTGISVCEFAFDDKPIRQWRPTQGEQMPADLSSALTDPSILKYAYKCDFERSIFKNVLGVDIPVRQWRDVMIMARACSFPAKLSEVCKILDLPAECQGKDGGVLPERAVYEELKFFDLSDDEWDLWCIDQKINERGMPINMKMVKNACSIREHLIPALTKQITDITGLSTPNNRDNLLVWLRAHGYQFNNLTADSVSRALAVQTPNTNLWRVLRLRQQISKNASAKFPAFLDATSADGRLRQSFNFCGTKSGRWTASRVGAHSLAGHSRDFDPIKFDILPSGNKIVVESGQIVASRAVERLNPASFSMYFNNPMEVLGGAVRNAIQATDGRMLVSADLKFIEHLVLGYLSGDEMIIDVIKSGKDPYLAFATQIYSESYDNLLKEHQNGDKNKRNFAKPGLLGCGFMMAAQELREQAARAGVDMTLEEAKHIVKIWRTTYKEVPCLWNFIMIAARRCVQSGEPANVGRISFEMAGDFLKMVLPSGRGIYYHKPEVKERRGAVAPSLTYSALDDNVWKRVAAHGGKMVQHAVSGIARDIFANGLKLADARGLNIVMHLHDQPVLDEEDKFADEALTALKECITTPPAWWGDLPIYADGYISKCFIKD